MVSGRRQTILQPTTHRPQARRTHRLKACAISSQSVNDSRGDLELAVVRVLGDEPPWLCIGGVTAYLGSHPFGHPEGLPANRHLGIVHRHGPKAVTRWDIDDLPLHAR